MPSYLTKASGTIPKEVATLKGIPCRETYTDGKDLFGAVLSKEDRKIVLWRLSMVELQEPKLTTVDLPAQEIVERSVLDMIEEAWRDGAWED
jgi:hypothetical protein